MCLTNVFLQYYLYVFLPYVPKSETVCDWPAQFSLSGAVEIIQPQVSTVSGIATNTYLTSNLVTFQLVYCQNSLVLIIQSGRISRCEAVLSFFAEKSSLLSDLLSLQEPV